MARPERRWASKTRLGRRECISSLSSPSAPGKSNWCDPLFDDAFLVVKRNVSHLGGVLWVGFAMSTATESLALGETLLPQVDGRQRVVIEGVYPEVDGGQFPIKRVAGESVVVEGDIFPDGQDLMKRGKVPQDLRIDFLIGADLLEDAAGRASGADSLRLADSARLLRGDSDQESKVEVALSDETAALMDRYPARRFATRYDKELIVIVEREKALFSTWYEVFPRSCAPEPGRHGTFRDCELWLPYIASMGFDVVYLPP